MRNLVIKCGTDTLVRDGLLDQQMFDSIARQVHQVKNLGVAVTIVSSGAIKAGRESVETKAFGAARLSKKDLAGIGARHLLHRWGSAFEACGEEIAQIWVTYTNWVNEDERGNIRSALRNYHQYGVVPIVNENDVISPQEIHFMEQGISENDRLARMVAELIGADAVLFLTSAGGVYDADPVEAQAARCFREIDRITALKIASMTSSASANGRGGIGAKLREAVECTQSGIIAVIAGIDDTSIVDFVDGKEVGTWIGNSIRFRKRPL